MSVDLDPVDEYSGSYGRSIPETEDLLDPVEIARGYAEHKGVTGGEAISAEFAYEAVLGSVDNENAEVWSILHYIRPTGILDNDFEAGATGKISATKNLADSIHSNIQEESIMYIGGIETPLREDLQTLGGSEIYPETIHSIVFYDSPDFTEMELKERHEFEDEVHKKVVLDALEGKSLGTALVVSGKEKISGKVRSALRVDYWPACIESQISDFGDINWDNPKQI